VPHPARRRARTDRAAGAGERRRPAVRHYPLAEARVNKLKLDLDALAVESFATLAVEADGGGTVQGQEFVLTPKCVVTSGINSCWCTEQSCP
jgi:hypothetical protein